MQLSKTSQQIYFFFTFCQPFVGEAIKQGPIKVQITMEYLIIIFLYNFWFIYFVQFKHRSILVFFESFHLFMNAYRYIIFTDKRYSLYRMNLQFNDIKQCVCSSYLHRSVF